jgi:phospholipid transport system substrate-binding protein
MLQTFKKLLFLSVILLNSINLISEENPYIFIENNSQKMVMALKDNKSLFEENRDLYESKIKEIFEPMIDFKRVAASVMGKKYYLSATPVQRNAFVEIFKDSLLNTYSETLAQWDDQTITTIFPVMKENFQNLSSIEVQQKLNTGSSSYPISYKLRKNKNNTWSIVNIIVNGVNLGLTFRNQFKALANKNGGDIERTIEGWVSDAGDAGISG